MTILSDGEAVLVANASFCHLIADVDFDFGFGGRL